MRLFGEPLRRTNAEKRRAVSYVLSASARRPCSDEGVARACSLSRSLVAAMRREFKREQEIDKTYWALVRAWRDAPLAARRRFIDDEGALLDVRRRAIEEGEAP